MICHQKVTNEQAHHQDKIFYDTLRSTVYLILFITIVYFYYREILVLGILSLYTYSQLKQNERRTIMRAF